MRLEKMVPWVGCVWFLGVTAGSWPDPSSLAVPAAAAETKRAPRKPAKKKAAIYRCVDYSQDEAEEGMDLHLRNRCGMDLQCSMSWEVACQSEDASTKAGSVFDLEDATANGAFASAASCGDDGWEIRKIRWSCSPHEG